jgi:hypothetical protein
MKINPSRFLSAFAKNIGILSPLLLIAAIGCAAFAVSSVKSAAGAVATGSKSTPGGTVTLTHETITAEQAMTSARRLATLSPTVRIAVNGPNIVISAAASEQFAEWVHAVTALQSTSADVIWKAEEICLSACEGGAAARAVVSGFRQRFSTRS